MPPVIVGGKLKLKSTKKLKAKSTKKKTNKKNVKRKEREGLSVENDIIESSEETDAQKKHKKYKEKREAEELKVIASKTYREQVENYNQYLDGLTEHHDVPKVSAAGNG